MSARELWMWACPHCTLEGVADSEGAAQRAGREHIDVSHPVRLAAERKTTEAAR